MTQNVNYEPGSATYSPVYSAGDDVIIPRTRTSHKRDAADLPGSVHSIAASSLVPPSPSVGGEAGQYSQLGWSTGFGLLKRKGAFTGRVLTGVRAQLLRVGHVGFSTRSQRLKNGVNALANDYTPNSTELAQEIVKDM